MPSRHEQHALGVIREMNERGWDVAVHFKSDGAVASLQRVDGARRVHIVRDAQRWEHALCLAAVDANANEAQAEKSRDLRDEEKALRAEGHPEAHGRNAGRW
jgi:hypothetical protein